MKNPKWVNAIPQSQNHGSGILEKKLWRLVSDLVRIRDWYAYHCCIATGVIIERWQDGQAGHFKSYTACHGMYKFDEENIHLQSATSNGWGGAEIGATYWRELCRRYGDDISDQIDRHNRLHLGEKHTQEKIIEKMEDVLRKMADLPEQPDYYRRIMQLK